MKTNKRGYSKFLKIDNDVSVSICEDKIKEDEQWDGLKGYVTNTTLSPSDVVSQYRGWWVVERAFRVSKGTIETRPIFHFTERRIEGHVCLCFVAFPITSRRHSKDTAWRILNTPLYPISYFERGADIKAAVSDKTA